MNDNTLQIILIVAISYLLGSLPTAYIITRINGKNIFEVGSGNMGGTNVIRALVLEDCDRFPPDEVALFHLINLARETGLFIVMTARLAPDLWGIRTPDLLSRLRLQPLLELHEPDDALLAALFVKHFSDRQISVETHVVTYAMARIERSYAAVQDLVAALDRQSLIRKKPVTRALVAEILGDSAPETDDDA